MSCQSPLPPFTEAGGKNLMGCLLICCYFYLFGFFWLVFFIYSSPVTVVPMWHPVSLNTDLHLTQHRRGQIWATGHFLWVDCIRLCVRIADACSLSDLQIIWVLHLCQAEWPWLGGYIVCLWWGFCMQTWRFMVELNMPSTNYPVPVNACCSCRCHEIMLDDAREPSNMQSRIAKSIL